MIVIFGMKHGHAIFVVTLLFVVVVMGIPRSKKENLGVA
jgi:hypothetical protein